MPRPAQKHYTYIGIDPGAKGGLCSISGSSIDLESLSGTERDIWDWFDFVGDVECKAFIEQVNRGFPGTSKANMAALYGSYMQLRGFLVAADIPYEVITSGKWQKGLGIKPKGKNERPTKWKNRLKQKAEQLFPQVYVTLATCDALLLAEYCRRKHQGVL